MEVSDGDLYDRIVVQDHKIEVEDVIRASKRAIFYFYGPVAFFFGFAAAWAISTQTEYPVYAFFITGIVCAIAVPYSVIDSYRKRLKRPNNKRIFQPTDLTIDSHFISGECNDGSKWQLPWSAFVRARLVGNLILLYPSDAQSIILSREILGEQASNRIDEILVRDGLLRHVQKA